MEERRSRTVEGDRDTLESSGRNPAGLGSCAKTVPENAGDRARRSGSTGAKGSVTDNRTDSEHRQGNRATGVGAHVSYGKNQGCVALLAGRNREGDSIKARQV